MPQWCRLCLDGAEDEGTIEASIREYISLLPVEIRTERATYEARLTKCAVCAHLAGYTCLLCGCYVQMRAAKQHMICPDVSAQKW